MSESKWVDDPLEYSDELWAACAQAELCVYCQKKPRVTYKGGGKTTLALHCEDCKKLCTKCHVHPLVTGKLCDQCRFGTCIAPDCGAVGVEEKLCAVHKSLCQKCWYLPRDNHLERHRKHCHRCHKYDNRRHYVP